MSMHTYEMLFIEGESNYSREEEKCTEFWCMNSYIDSIDMNFYILTLVRRDSWMSPRTDFPEFRLLLLGDSNQGCRTYRSIILT
jgi:hypothetical protein